MTFNPVPPIPSFASTEIYTYIFEFTYIYFSEIKNFTRMRIKLSDVMLLVDIYTENAKLNKFPWAEMRIFHRRDINSGYLLIDYQRIENNETDEAQASG